MSRVAHAIEKLLRIFKENSDTEFVDLLFGTSAPGGDAGEQDAASIGSLYLQQNGASSAIYQKKANVGNASDWEVVGSTALQVTFRPEKVRAVTGDSATTPGVARDLTASPFSDDEGTQLTASDFTVGEFIIDTSGGTARLLEVTNVSAPNVTFSTPNAGTNPQPAEGDTFISLNYLPDTPGDQEGQALVQTTSTGSMIKIGDIDWNFADGINLNGSIVDNNGPVAGTDTVQVAIEKLEGDAKDSHQALGIARGDTDMGTYPGDILTDNSSQTTINSELEAAIESISKVFTGTAAQNTPVTVDSLSVDNFQRVTYVVTARETSNPANVKSLEINMAHNGHGAADASQIDDSVSERLTLGNFNLQVDATLTGAAGTQAMNLVLESSEAGGINWTVERLSALPLAG